MIQRLIHFFKRPVVRILLTAWVLFYVISQVTYSQTFRNILGLPVIIWTIYALINTVVKARRAKQQLLADIKSFSQISDPAYFDTCRESAIALNYANKTIYIIDDGKQKAMLYSDILRWEMEYKDGGGLAIGGVSINGATAAAALFGVGFFSLLGRYLYKTNDIGYVKFWVNDAEHTIISVYVSNNAIIEKMQHFSMVNGLKVH
ncbi:hypothetical protein [Undibacterium sp. TJN19]|uniref:hypothetical protein n=1 Tax=Undibacterium sp. TJN19 TaxID=3413055 RepID=UPI003BF0157F